MSNILIPVAILSSLGLVFGVLLGIAAKIFKIEEDERIATITEILPGANCGACGFAGCSAYANAIVNDNAKINQCSVGGKDVVDQIADVMGIASVDFVKMVARVKCVGTKDKVKTKYEYSGIEDCFAVNKLGGGQKECLYGCLGYGTCVKACMYGALEIVDGVAKANKEKCTACGMCVTKCPKNLIQIIPYDKNYSVGCNNKDKGPITKDVCFVGCIACKICEKNCPTNAITINNFLAEIDYEKCTNCGICVEKCPKKVIG